MSDTGHLYHDACLVGSTFSELDAREYLRIREQNARENVRLLSHNKNIDRAKAVVERRHRHEKELIKSKLHDIVARTPRLGVSEPVRAASAVNKASTLGEKQATKRWRSASLPSIKDTSSKNGPQSLPSVRSHRTSLASSKFTFRKSTDLNFNQDFSLKSTTKFQIKRVSHITRSLNKIYTRIAKRQEEQKGIDNEEEHVDKIQFEELSKKNKETVLRAKVVLKNSRYRDKIEAELPDKVPQTRLLSWLAHHDSSTYIGDEDDIESVYDDEIDAGYTCRPNSSSADSVRLGESAMGHIGVDNVTEYANSDVLTDFEASGGDAELETATHAISSLTLYPNGLKKVTFPKIPHM